LTAGVLCAITAVSIRSRVAAVLLFVLACSALPAAAEVLNGEVVALADGDTVTVLDGARRQHRVRLAGIDAPEKSQPFGAASRQSLAALVFRRQVVVEWHKRDRYGRIVGKVLFGPQDVCLEQVRRGMAWHYKRFAGEQLPADRQNYGAAEEEARRLRRGLWLAPNPTPPWDFRRGA
jgi:endonuclease YncB( thermonuclease family)